MSVAGHTVSSSDGERTLVGAGRDQVLPQIVVDSQDSHRTNASEAEALVGAERNIELMAGAIPSTSAPNAVIGALGYAGDASLAPPLPIDQIVLPIDYIDTPVPEIRRKRPASTSPEGIKAELLTLYEELSSLRLVDDRLAALSTSSAIRDPGSSPPVSRTTSRSASRSRPSSGALSPPLKASSGASTPRRQTLSTINEDLNAQQFPSPSRLTAIPSEPHTEQSSPLLASRTISNPLESLTLPPPSPINQHLQTAHEAYGTPSDLAAPRNKEWETFHLMWVIARHGCPLPPLSLLETVAYRPCDLYHAVHWARDIVLYRARAILECNMAPTEGVRWATDISRVYGHDGVWWEVSWDARDDFCRGKFLDVLAEVRESRRWSVFVVRVLRKKVLL